MEPVEEFVSIYKRFRNLLDHPIKPSMAARIFEPKSGVDVLRSLERLSILWHSFSDQEKVQAREAIDVWTQV